MEDLHIISAIKEQEKEKVEKKPVEVALDAIRKMNNDIDEIKAIMKEMRQEFKDLNENAKKGWFY